MAKNIEIKARVKDAAALFERAVSNADQGPQEINQDDTFFNCQTGRLKLRTYSDDKGDLIFYQRPDESGPKQSFYVISPTCSPATLLESLTLAYGVAGRVIKKRILFMVGRTRIHLDQVERLGDFVELEVVLKEGESTENGVAEAEILMEKLLIDPADLVEGAYVDLITGQSV